MKKFNARKYFLFVIPSAILYRVISYYGISRLITSQLYLRFLDTVMLVIIFFVCLYFARETKEK